MRSGTLSTIAAGMLAAMAADGCDAAAAGQAGNRQAGGGQAGDAQAGTATRFVRDPARFRANQQKLIVAMRVQSPEAAAALERAFSQDLLAAVAPDLSRLRIDPSDMADMTAAYWVTAWEASHDIVGRQTDPALLAGARRQIAGTLARDAARMRDGDKQDVADTMLFQTLLVDARMKAAAQGGADARRRMSDAVHAEATALLKTDLRQMRLTPAGFSPANGASDGTSTPAKGAASAAPAGAHAANWQKVEGVYFKSYSTFGVGGLMIQDFEPVILFRDGSYYEVEGDALEDVDLAASRARTPGAWGRWRKQGATFLLTDNKGSTNDYQLQQGSFFKAFPAESTGGKLSRRYKRISGGGNSAMGGTMAIAAQSNFTFAPDGRFATGTSMGAVGATVAASSRRGGGMGRYRVERHSITLTGPDGRPRREFFAFGSQGTPARLDTDMIFIGDRVFVKDD